jgi:hypothetical protein
MLAQKVASNSHKEHDRANRPQRRAILCLKDIMKCIIDQRGTRTRTDMPACLERNHALLWCLSCRLKHCLLLLSTSVITNESFHFFHTHSIVCMRYSIDFARSLDRSLEKIPVEPRKDSDIQIQTLAYFVKFWIYLQN